MPNVDITMNNRIFRISCDVGQEERLRDLAAWADERLQLIAQEVGQVGDTRLMLLTLLMTCDELFDLRHKIKSGDQPLMAQSTQAEEGAAQIIDAATKRVNALNDRLDQ